MDPTFGISPQANSATCYEELAALEERGDPGPLATMLTHLDWTLKPPLWPHLCLLPHCPSAWAPL